MQKKTGEVYFNVNVFLHVIKYVLHLLVHLPHFVLCSHIFTMNNAGSWLNLKTCKGNFMATVLREGNCFIYMDQLVNRKN